MPARGQHAQGPLHKLATRLAVDAEAQLAFDHAAAQATLSGVVRWLHSRDFRKRPQCVKVFPDVPAHSGRFFVAGYSSLFQQVVHFALPNQTFPLQCRASQSATFEAMPVVKNP
ncbi:hypothetical protein [uncultured Rubinisphaera sp.]|uniref:hypothetical protein n=1 Tax=uncultured Rubinisphaera sp. TaxID=1678686 RepID=UPI0026A906F2